MNFSPPRSSFSPSDFFPPPAEIASTSIKTRARRPCDACRRRKSRCEMDGPLPCVLCRFHRQECTFVEDPLPRKRKASSLNGEDKSLENRDFVRRNMVPEKTETTTRSTPDASKIRQDPPINNYANLKGPSLLKKTLGLQNHRHSRLIGSTSQYEHLLLEIGDYHEKEEVSIGSSALRKVNHLDTAFVLSPDQETRNHEDEIPDLDAIESTVAPHGHALIHLYFRIVHPSFPVLHKKVFLEKYQRTHREFSPPLLAAVYILALNWWSYSTELALLPKPDIARLEKLAFKTMNDIIYRPKLSTIQAGLLLLQRPEGDSWALTTQLVGLAQDLGLHLDCSNWRIPSWERGLRKRLAWAVFMQDKWGSLVHGRPSHITTTDWAVQPLDENDFPENAADEDDEDGSTEVEKGRALFCEMIRLSELLSSVLSAFYTMRAEHDFEEHAEEGVRWILERAKPIQMALRQWHSNLPTALRMENIAMRKLSSTDVEHFRTQRSFVEGGAHNSAGQASWPKPAKSWTIMACSRYLHLGYYAVEITLHRRIIRSLSSVDDANIRGICRQAAQTRLKSAMDFVQSLRPEHLQSFWYSASKYCFALVGTFISLLWATALEKEEANLYKAKLDEYRWTLRLSSKSADFLERALTMLATSTGILIKAIPDSPDPDVVLNRRPARTSSSDPAPAEDALRRQVYEQSESEIHDDTSPEYAGETPLSSGAASGWNADRLWFGGGAEMAITENVGNQPGNVGSGDGFMQLPDMVDISDGYNYGRLLDHD